MSTRKPDLTDPKQAWGRCLIESKIIAERFARKGTQVLYVRITGQNYPGREHWAVFIPASDDETAGRVIDLTCRQFSAAAPAKFDGDLNDWLDDAVEWLRDDLVVEVYQNEQGVPLWGDVWSREDCLPGGLVYPWQTDSDSHATTRIGA